MEQIENIMRGLPWYMYVILGLSLGMVITGFFLPPMGVVDGSVITVVGELIGGTAIFHTIVNIPLWIKLGVKTKIKTKTAEIELTGGSEKEIKELSELK